MELKEIDSPVYCRPTGELCHVTCKGEDFNRIFVTKEAFVKWSNEDYTPVVPSPNRCVRACFNVLECGHAFCNDCYLKLVLNSDGEGNDRSSRRRRI